MRRLLVLLVMAGSVVFLPSANACMCGRGTQVETPVRDADIAFVGEVTKGLTPYHWEVRVLAVAKGRVPGKVALRDEGARTSCGSAAPPPGRPFVYAGPNDLDAAPCGRRIRNADAIEKAGLTTYAPYHDPNTPIGTPTMLAMIGLLALGVRRLLSARRNAAASAGGTASAG